MLSHARGPLKHKQAERKRFIFCSFFAQKKAQKPVTLRNGQAIRGSEHSTPGRRIITNNGHVTLANNGLESTLTLPQVEG